MNFYKNVIEHRGKLLVRGIHEGKEFKEKIVIKVVVNILNNCIIVSVL